MKKYEFTGETKVYKNRTLHQIRALHDFCFIKKGEVGGWIEHEGNLSHEGKCWVYEDSYVFDNASVSEDATVRGDSKIYDNAVVTGHIRVRNASIYENAEVYGYGEIYDGVKIHGYAYASSCYLNGTIELCGGDEDDPLDFSNAHLFFNDAIAFKNNHFLCLPFAFGGYLSFITSVNSEIMVNDPLLFISGMKINTYEELLEKMDVKSPVIDFRIAAVQMAKSHILKDESRRNIFDIQDLSLSLQKKLLGD